MPSKKTRKQSAKPAKPSAQAVAALRRELALAGISATRTPDGSFAWSVPNMNAETLRLLAWANKMRAAGVDW